MLKEDGIPQGAKSLRDPVSNLLDMKGLLSYYFSTTDSFKEIFDNDYNTWKDY